MSDIFLNFLVICRDSYSDLAGQGCRIHYLENSPPEEDNICLASEEILRFYDNVKVIIVPFSVVPGNGSYLEANESSPQLYT